MEAGHDRSGTEECEDEEQKDCAMDAEGATGE